VPENSQGNPADSWGESVMTLITVSYEAPCRPVIGDGG
jgi:hypothetical protein